MDSSLYLKAIGQAIQAATPKDFQFVVEGQEDNKLQSNTFTLRMLGPDQHRVSKDETRIIFNVDILIIIQKNSNVYTMSHLVDAVSAVMLVGFSVPPYGCFLPQGKIERIDYGQLKKESPLIATSISCEYSLILSEE